MKKIFLFASAFALVLTSCSSSDGDGSSSADGLLPKRVTDVSTLDGTLVTDIVYNGNKLVSATDSDGVIEQYTYSGDKITTVKHYFEDFLEQQDNYTYDSQGRVTQYQRIDFDGEIGNRETFTYNANGTVSTIQYTGDETTQTVINSRGIIYFTNNEVSKIEAYEADGTTLVRTVLYTYDAKNNPFKNITGFNAISYTDGDAGGILHNLATMTIDGATFTNTMTYNSSDYPTTIVERNPLAEIESTVTIVYQ
ncbi:MAG: hypothetical protein QM710_05795 [Flavobacterium sp.]